MRNVTAKQILCGVVVLILLLLFPWVIEQPFPQHVMILVFMFGMMGVAWNIMGGYA